MSSTLKKVDYVKKDLPPLLTKFAYGLTAIGLVLVILAYLTDHTRSAYNNVVLLMFLISIGLGSLFLVALEYLGGAVWSTPFRRIAEFLAAILLIVPIVAIPIYFNMHELYHWMHHEAVQSDPILKGKAAYLNINFFTIRVVAFFAVWILFYYLITNNSKKQDTTGDPKLTKINTKLSAIFIPIFALTLTFSAIDWMMSLEAHWFSTMFGVYYFAGIFLGGISAITFLIVYLNEKGNLVKGLVPDHYYSFGVFMFGFVNFWAYIAFSQYMLIWYANLPEETIWFIHRWEGSWVAVSLIIIFIHFVIPFFVMVSQASKMNPAKLKFMAIWILIAHYIDLYWVVLPVYSPKGAVFGWIEFSFLILGFGLMLLVFVLKAKNNNMVPIGDPKLQRGIDFRL